jgi:uncharacterized protein (DUF4415 family)
MSKKSITKEYLEADIPDKDIDLSDIPETNEAFWADAIVEWPDKKQLISIRIDSDILAYFRSKGKGYQSRINAVLRTYVDRKKQTEQV